MGNKILADKKHFAESAFLNRALLKYMTQELCCRIPSVEAENLYYFTGISLGEDYCYNFLHLEDSLDSLLKGIESISEPICFSKVSICSVSPDLETVTVSYSPLPGRNDSTVQHCRMRCQFLKGFISGILCAYTGKSYRAEYLCNRVKKQNDSLPCISQFSLITNENEDVRALWEI